MLMRDSLLSLNRRKWQEYDKIVVVELLKTVVRSKQLLVDSFWADRLPAGIKMRLIALVSRQL